ncbi:MAG TPA: hypothetical protein VNZ86_17865, partial [Bacteroidia bacterium]|nr:hypothetical protein [Bacteroidia bacterium]
MKRNLLLFTAFLVCIGITLFSSGIPLFWDAVYYALPATNEYKFGFNPFDIQETYDTGGFPFYALLLKIAWRVLTDNLLVTHLALLPFLLGLVFAFYRISKLFLTNKIQIWALFFLFLEPCFLTQSILAAPDIILLSFFLLALMCLLEKRRVWYGFFVLALPVCNMRGIPAAAALLVLDLLLTDPYARKIKNTVQTYIPAFLLTVGWFVYHRMHTGWYFFSPWREQTDEHGVSLFLMLKHVILISWKLMDSGRVILWIFLALGIVYFRKNKDPHF